jgi:hypothetical protein
VNKHEFELKLNHNKWVALTLFILSFLLFFILSAKQFTWIAGSGDSGDWLASALSWIPPQPFGNPLFILMGHVLAHFPGSLVIWMTAIGSCLPAAITVSAVYLITCKLTGKQSLAIVSSLILLGAVVFTSQALVLSEYPLPVMFVTLAFLFYLRDKRLLTAIMLGLGSACHVVVIVIAVLWLLIEWRQGGLREWIHPSIAYLLIAFLPYLLTLWELWRFNGHISIHILLSYIQNSSGMGALALSAFPSRLLHFVGYIIVSLGIALIPICITLFNKTSRDIKGYWLMIAVIIFPCWYYLTSIDPTAWHYLPWVMPFLAVLGGIGIGSLGDNMGKVIIVGAGCLLIANVLFLNASILASQNPIADNLYHATQDLPTNCDVAIRADGWDGFDVRYVQVNGRKDITRIDFSDVDSAIADGKQVFVLESQVSSVVSWIAYNQFWDRVTQ